LTVKFADGGKKNTNTQDAALMAQVLDCAAFLLLVGADLALPLPATYN